MIKLSLFEILVFLFFLLIGFVLTSGNNHALMALPLWPAIFMTRQILRARLISMPQTETPLPTGLQITKMIIDNSEYLFASRSFRYTGHIRISPHMRKRLGLEFKKNTIQKTKNSKYDGLNAFIKGNDGLISLKYMNAEPIEDEFLYGGKLLKIKYINKNSKTALEPRPMSGHHP
jgi:hypothetical protein